MVEELAMISVLAGMGVYFVKSTELPKDLKERELNRGTTESVSSYKPKFNFQNKVSDSIEVKLKVPEKPKINIQAIEIEINELTFKITELEQEIRDNNTKNQQIQSLIEKHMDRLVELNLIKNQA